VTGTELNDAALQVIGRSGQLLSQRGGRGAGKKILEGWVGGTCHFGAEGGTPTPSCDHPTPPLLCRRGEGPSPARRMLHAKHTFWDWKHGGVGPSFFPDKGGGGSWAGFFPNPQQLICSFMGSVEIISPEPNRICEGNPPPKKYSIMHPVQRFAPRGEPRRGGEHPWFPRNKYQDVTYGLLQSSFMRNPQAHDRIPAS